MLEVEGRNHDTLEVIPVAGLQLRGKEFGYVRGGLDLAVEGLVLHHQRDAVVVIEGAVITQFIIDPETNEHRHGHTDRQAADVDEGVALVADQVAVGDFQIIADHGYV